MVVDLPKKVINVTDIAIITCPISPLTFIFCCCCFLFCFVLFCFLLFFFGGGGSMHVGKTLSRLNESENYRQSRKNLRAFTTTITLARTKEKSVVKG